MSHLVITIGCEYGAKGNQIGRKIAEDLGFQFYDRNIVDAIIHEVGIPGEIMEKVEEGVTIVGKGAEGWLEISIIQRDRKDRRDLKHQTESTGEKRKTGCCRIDGVIYSVSVPFA